MEVVADRSHSKKEQQLHCWVGYTMEGASGRASRMRGECTQLWTLWKNNWNLYRLFRQWRNSLRTWRCVTLKKYCGRKSRFKTCIRCWMMEFFEAFFSDVADLKRSKALINSYKIKSEASKLEMWRIYKLTIRKEIKECNIFWNELFSNAVFTDWTLVLE